MHEATKSRSRHAADHATPGSPRFASGKEEGRSAPCTPRRAPERLSHSQQFVWPAARTSSLQRTCHAPTCDKAAVIMRQRDQPVLTPVAAPSDKSTRAQSTRTVPTRERATPLHLHHRLTASTWDTPPPAPPPASCGPWCSGTRSASGCTCALCRGPRSRASPPTFAPAAAACRPR